MRRGQSKTFPVMAIAGRGKLPSDNLTSGKLNLESLIPCWQTRHHHGNLSTTSGSANTPTSVPSSNQLTDTLGHLTVTRNAVDIRVKSAPGTLKYLAMITFATVAHKRVATFSVKLSQTSTPTWIHIDVDKICITIKKNLIYLISPDPGEYAETVSSVYFSTEKGHKRFMKERLTTPKAKVFVGLYEFVGDEAANFDFHLELGSKRNSGFSCRRIDDKLVDLWDAAVNRRGTDVQFVVGNKIFTAHSVVLLARSPVLASIYAKQPKPDLGPVQIALQNAHPVHFEKFLQFLYTGIFEWPSFKAELLELALLYQVSSLVKICNTVNAEILDDEIVHMIALIECT